MLRAPGCGTLGSQTLPSSSAGPPALLPSLPPAAGPCVRARPEPRSERGGAAPAGAVRGPARETTSERGRGPSPLRPLPNSWRGRLISSGWPRPRLPLSLLPSLALPAQLPPPLLAARPGSGAQGAARGELRTRTRRRGAGPGSAPARPHGAAPVEGLPAEWARCRQPGLLLAEEGSCWHRDFWHGRSREAAAARRRHPAAAGPGSGIRASPGSAACTSRFSSALLFPLLLTAPSCRGLKYTPNAFPAVLSGMGRTGAFANIRCDWQEHGKPQRMMELLSGGS